MAFLHWDGLLSRAGPDYWGTGYLQNSLRRKAGIAGFIAGLAGEIRMRRWRKIRCDASMRRR
jgi:hypothetical protein